MIDTITPNVPIAINASLKVDEVRVLARSTETISDAANGMDQWIRLLIVDLPAYATDVDVDNVGGGIEMKIPDVLQQHRPRHDTPFVPRKIFQKLEFPRQQNNVLAAPGGGPRN